MNDDEVGTPFQMEKVSSSRPELSFEVVCEADDLDCLYATGGVR